MVIQWKSVAYGGGVWRAQDLSPAILSGLVSWTVKGFWGRGFLIGGIIAVDKQQGPSSTHLAIKPRGRGRVRVARLKPNTVALGNEAVVLKGRGFQPRRPGVRHGFVILSTLTRGCE